jgi:hypothetical protein
MRRSRSRNTYLERRVELSEKVECGVASELNYYLVKEYLREGE